MSVAPRNWLLPEHVEDVLPASARHLEQLRRTVLDRFAVHGYELVVPPMLEYLESLLTGTGHDLDLRTLKLVDQMSGRMVGLRADITPQVARIDAHLLNRAGPVRLCYCGTVLHALPAGIGRTREPLQIGAELYGHAGVESDLEIQQLMLDALAAVGVRGVHLDLGHVGPFRALVREAAVDAATEAALFEALQGKDVPTLRTLVADLAPTVRDALLALPALHGDVAVLDTARRVLPPLPDIVASLDVLDTIAARLARPEVTVLFDLAEVRGYHYHSGVVFAAYAPGSVEAIARGGRYDEVGRAFGRARPATGFTIDLRDLAALLAPPPPLRAVLAPHAGPAGLADVVAALRADGEIVVVELPGHPEMRHEIAHDRVLAHVDGRWCVVPRTT
ncbi:MAG: ATP phosphoribosyltransferase regulatory subunit [Burkholderiales bacterium]|jgi:ATP phosphoribosyltransferase regulatory subunit|nr:ATP phosphoribosyltransferase regulatory subunit [Burkholderiales bacterium]